MTKPQLGQVFVGRAPDARQLVVVQADEHNVVAVNPRNANEAIALGETTLATLTPLPATENDRYLEAVMPSGDLFWSVFIPGFEAAYTFYRAQKPDIAEAGGYIRIGTAADATDAQRQTFNEILALGPERFVGLQAAIARVKAKGESSGE